MSEVARESGVNELAGWTAQAELDPQVRYGALRRLEGVAPERALEAALELLDDPSPLVRANAVAVLARSQDPRAQQALERVDPKYHRLARALARQGR